MKYYGTKNNKDYGFYEHNFENAIEITDEYWMELLEAQNDGKIIILYNNNVIAVDETQYSNENGVWKQLTEEEAQYKQLKIQNAIRINEIQAELNDLDRKRIRAIAEPALKDENQTWLEYYNLQIIELRNELNEITQ